MRVTCSVKPDDSVEWIQHTVDGKKSNPPRKVFGRNLLPRHRRGTRIGGNDSYQPRGAPLTLQDPEQLSKAEVFDHPNVSRNM